ncbi:hypothetical protein JBP901_gp021 [Bacillus phage JBP901]|uniref:Putative membrane protein n=2 Tax=Caeruleovirus TaxID=1911929 RepID=A0A0E3DEU8_9CAUD|nr:hypothetical protein JBP901_gp021 [Bacillus phage JBP901]YP_009149609.1 hypothetical protein BCP8-2_048 [Bacillus phage BCP8-2]AHJ87086.1 putative membrane protein [Bacillus phage BCP8-2]AID17734.1 putative membrane protein [Bacillus phage JBP901]
MILWDNILIVLCFSGVLFALFYGWKKFKSLDKEDRAVVGKLDDGSLIFKTEDGRYFYAVDDEAIPVLINKEEGDRLWSQSTELKYAEDN